MLKNNSGRVSSFNKKVKQILNGGVKGWVFLGVYKPAVLPKAKRMQSLIQLYLNHHENAAYVVHSISKHLVNKIKIIPKIIPLIVFISFYKYHTIAASRISIVSP